MPPYNVVMTLGVELNLQCAIEILMYKSEVTEERFFILDFVQIQGTIERDYHKTRTIRQKPLKRIAPSLP